MARSLVGLLCCGVLLLALPRAVAQPESSRPPPPGVGGDARLAAGFDFAPDKGVRWGIADEILVRVAPLPFEPVAALQDDHSGLIHVGEHRVVELRFWRHRLYEVRVHSELSPAEGKALVGRIEERLGPAVHAATAPPDPVETWTWTDPFTRQVLSRALRGERWTLRRWSRVIDARRFAELRRAAGDGERLRVDALMGGAGAQP